jgi:RNA polymerase sigma factor (TIGR02999 family)
MVPTDRQEPSDPANTVGYVQEDTMHSDPPDQQISQILHDPNIQPAADLLPLVYDQLRRLARSRLANERPGQTLQPTALVHEAYLRITNSSGTGWEGKRHFFAAAAEAMRRILINQARGKAAVKRGGEMQRQDITWDDLGIESPGEKILQIEEALEALEAADPRAREIVNLRYFAGLTTAETAEALAVSASTVEREWRFIRSFLADALGEAP